MPISFQEIGFYASYFSVAFVVVAVFGLVFLLLFKFVPFLHVQSLPIKFGVAWTLAHFVIVIYLWQGIFSNREPDAWLFFWIPDYPVSLSIHIIDAFIKVLAERAKLLNDSVNSVLTDHVVPLITFGVLGSAQYGLFGFIIGKVVSKFLR